MPGYWLGGSGRGNAGDCEPPWFVVSERPVPSLRLLAGRSSDGSMGRGLGEGRERWGGEDVDGPGV